MRSVLWGLVVIAGCFGMARAAEPDAIVQARTHFRAGTVFFDAGLYDRAISEYETAYALDPLPALLFDMAQAYRLKGDARTATSYYQRYLEANGRGAIADEARDRLRELAASVSHPKEAEPSSRAPSGPSDFERSPSSLSRSMKEPETITPPRSTVATAAAAAPRTTPRRRWIWAAAAAAVVVVAGVAIGVGVALSGPRYPTASIGDARLP
jgi:tetratricopeptide (TPR) repeat protein